MPLTCCFFSRSAFFAWPASPCPLTVKHVHRPTDEGRVTPITPSIPWTGDLSSTDSEGTNAPQHRAMVLTAKRRDGRPFFRVDQSLLACCVPSDSVKVGSFVEGMGGWFSHKIFMTHRCPTNATPKSYKKKHDNYKKSSSIQRFNLVSVSPAHLAGVSLDSHHAAVLCFTSNQHATTQV